MTEVTALLQEKLEGGRRESQAIGSGPAERLELDARNVTFIPRAGFEVHERRAGDGLSGASPNRLHEFQHRSEVVLRARDLEQDRTRRDATLYAVLIHTKVKFRLIEEHTPKRSRREALWRFGRCVAVALRAAVAHDGACAAAREGRLGGSRASHGRERENRPKIPALHGYLRPR
jgi:hypothetical protein